MAKLNTVARVIRHKLKVLSEPGYIVWHRIDGSDAAVMSWFDSGYGRLPIIKGDYIWHHWPVLGPGVDMLQTQTWDVHDDWEIDVGAVEDVPRVLTIRFMGVFTSHKPMMRVFVRMPDGRYV